MNTTEQELPGPVLEYLGEQSTLTLATASPTGAPHAATFLYVNEGPSLYFWSRSSTESARHIDQNPMVAFTIDDYTTDLNQTRGVQGVGECSVLLSGEQIARVADLFGQKFPSLSPGATMSISFFRITPTEIQFIDNKKSSSASPRGRVRRRVPPRAVLQRVRRPSHPDRPDDLGHAPVGRRRRPTPSWRGRGDRPTSSSSSSTASSRSRARTAAAPRPCRRSARGSCSARWRSCSTSLAAPAPARRSRRRLVVIDGDTFRAVVAQSLGTTRDFDQIIRDRLGRSAG